MKRLWVCVCVCGRVCVCVCVLDDLPACPQALRSVCVGVMGAGQTISSSYEELLKDCDGNQKDFGLKLSFKYH